MKHVYTDIHVFIDYANFQIIQDPVEDHLLRGKSIYFAIQRVNKEDALSKKTFQRPLVNVLHGKVSAYHITQGVRCLHE